MRELEPDATVADPANGALQRIPFAQLDLDDIPKARFEAAPDHRTACGQIDHLYGVLAIVKLEDGELVDQPMPVGVPMVASPDLGAWHHGPGEVGTAFLLRMLFRGEKRLLLATENGRSKAVRPILVTHGSNVDKRSRLRRCDAYEE